MGLFNKRKSLSGYSYGKKCIQDRIGKKNQINFFIGNFYLFPFIPGFIVEKKYDHVGKSFLKIIYYNGCIGFSKDFYGLSVGDIVLFNDSGLLFDFGLLGNGNSLSLVESGTVCSNICVEPARGKGTYILSGGSRGVGLGLSDNPSFSILKLPSGEIRKFGIFSKITIGLINWEGLEKFKNLKAGCLSFFGRKGHVRGVAKNPVDHPHGGGEGKSKGGRHPVSSWGLLSKGKKTRNKSKKTFTMEALV